MARGVRSATGGVQGLADEVRVISGGGTGRAGEDGGGVQYSMKTAQRGLDF